MLPVEATVVAFDGHPLGVGPAHKYSRPYLVPANTPIRLTTAQRHDIIIEAKTPISANARIDYYDWIKGVPGGLIATVFVPVNIA